MFKNYNDFKIALLDFILGKNNSELRDKFLDTEVKDNLKELLSTNSELKDKVREKLLSFIEE